MCKAWGVTVQVTPSYVQYNLTYAKVTLQYSGHNNAFSKSSTLVTTIGSFAYDHDTGRIGSVLDVKQQAIFQKASIAQKQQMLSGGLHHYDTLMAVNPTRHNIKFRSATFPSLLNKFRCSALNVVPANNYDPSFVNIGWFSTLLTKLTKRKSTAITNL